jgi:hypothetical protein
MKTRSGYRASPVDGRDYEWLRRSPGRAGGITLRHPSVRDQVDIPCCTCMAVVAAMEMLDLRDDGRARALSPLFLYYFARNSPRYLGDVAISAALAAATRYGVCSRSSHNPSMTEAGAKKSPSLEAKQQAQRQRLAGFDPNTGRTRYYRVSGSRRVSAMRSVLSAGLPLVIGFWTTSEYWNGKGMQRVLPEPTKGGHTAVVYASDGPEAGFRVLDSRGRSFAQGGCWYLSPDVVQSRLVSEIWTLERINY